MLPRGTLEKPGGVEQFAANQGPTPGGSRETEAASGRDILVYGSGELLATLIEHALVDEYRLIVYPVSLGTGKRLFRDDTVTKLKPTATKLFSSGVVALCYEPADRKAPVLTS